MDEKKGPDAELHMPDAQEAAGFSKRPENTPFKQQRLPSWQPILTPNSVILALIVIGAIFLIFGIVILSASYSVKEFSVRYDNIVKYNENGTVNLTISEQMDPPIYLYYQLSNFYQNHRRYVKSRSDDQLRGREPMGVSDLSDCDPLITNPMQNNSILYPCGLVANSFFNDKFTAFADGAPLNMSKTEISWASDRNYKFKTRSLEPQETNKGIRIVNGQNVSFDLPPPSDEEFIVWMRTAGLPTFRKLHRRILQALPANTILTFQIESHFEVESFGGTKTLVLSTTSWLGGRNGFLGWSYIAVAIVCVALAIMFEIKQKISPRRPGQMPTEFREEQ